MKINEVFLAYFMERMPKTRISDKILEHRRKERKR